jgi:hypothetical protein
LRSSVIDSPAALRARSRLALTAASALLGSTKGWSNSPSWNFNSRIRRTDSSIRRSETSPWRTAASSARFQPAESIGVMLMSMPAFTAWATAPVRSAATW